MNMMTKRC